MPTTVPFRPLRALRDGTLDLHAEAERHVRILDADATTTTYTRFLGRMLGFHGPLERAFASHDALAASGFDAASRRKRPLLEADLRSLGVDPETLPHARALPDVGSLPRALGAAYVVEGSTLGGAFIRRRMPPQLGHVLGKASAFLEGYGEATGPMWRRFGHIVDSSVDANRIADAIQAARDTFSRLIVWLDERRAAPPHPVFAFRGPREAAP